MMAPDAAGDYQLQSPLSSCPSIQIQTKNDTVQVNDQRHAENAAHLPGCPRSFSLSISDFYVCFKTLFSYNGTTLRRTATLSSPRPFRSPRNHMSLGTASLVGVRKAFM